MAPNLDKIPTGKVGGEREPDPWPDGTEDVERGATYKRPAPVGRDRTELKTVTVTQLATITNDAGEETDGSIVAFQHTAEDPNE